MNYFCSFEQARRLKDAGYPQENGSRYIGRKGTAEILYTSRARNSRYRLATVGELVTALTDAGSTLVFQHRRLEVIPPVTSDFGTFASEDGPIMSALVDAYCKMKGKTDVI